MKSVFKAIYIICAVLLLAPIVSFADSAGAPGPITALAVDSQSSVWAASGKGLRVIRAKSSSVREVALPDVPAASTVSAIATGADGRVYLSFSGGGIWTLDGDNSQWQSLNNGLPSANVTAMTAHSTQATTLYAYIPKDGIFRSKDGGIEWTQVDGGPQEKIQTFIHSNMPGSMESGWLFAGTERGIARSMDCFCLWSDAGKARGTVSSLTFDKANPMNVYALLNGQLYHSPDGGESWTELASLEGATAVTFSRQLGVIAGTEQGKLYSRNANGQWQALND